MNEKRDSYYKVAAEFDMNMNEAYKVWKRFNHYKINSSMSTYKIIIELRKEFENDLEILDFFTAFGLVMITDFMRGKE